MAHSQEKREINKTIPNTGITRQRLEIDCLIYVQGAKGNHEESTKGSQKNSIWMIQ